MKLLESDLLDAFSLVECMPEAVYNQQLDPIAFRINTYHLLSKLGITVEDDLKYLKDKLAAGV